MSFFFETIAIPFWFIVFIFASATPLWLRWYKKFHKKFIVTGILQKKFRGAKSVAEMKMDILKKATEHWNENSDLTGLSETKVKKRKTVKKNIDPAKKQNIQTVLKVLADAGEKGILPKSVSDNLNINTIETSNALTYLMEKKYAEEINSTNGTKYYLTDLGRRYCINKKYI
jgi:predicted transcriptional regulator